MEIIEVETNPIAPVAHLKLNQLVLVDKTNDEVESDAKVMTELRD